MSDLPEGWEWTTLGEVAETSLGKMLDRGKVGRDSRKVPYLRNANVQWGRFDLSSVSTMEIPNAEIGYFELRSGDLLVCEGGEVGRCAVWSGGISYTAFQKALHRVRPSGGIDPVFLRWALEFLAQSNVLARVVTGSTIKHLPQLRLRQVPIPLPPLAEQHRIVDAVDAALEGVQVGASSVRRARARIVDMERRIVAEALASTNVPARSSAEPPAPSEGVPVRDGDLAPLPAGWRWARLHEIAEVVGGVTKDAAKQSDPAVPLVPYLRVANVQRGYLDLDHVSEIRVPEAKVQKLELRAGDVLLNEGGDRDKLGRGWVWEGQIDRCIHQNHVFRARIRDGELHPKLLAWHANGFGHWFEANGKQSVNLASISLRTIRQLPVPVPLRDEQEGIVRRIEERLAETARLRQVLAAAEARAGDLRRAILAAAFAGRLVPQDPTDEPASELLARIRAERPPTSRRRTARR